MNRRADSPWLGATIERPGAAMRLFCFPYGGAGAAAFGPWREALGDRIELCPVQLPGREERMGEKLFRRIPPLVECLGPALRDHLDKPFAFFGHSVGAVIGFELARWLRERGAPAPRHLFVSGCNAPQNPEPQPWVHALPEAQFVEKLRDLDGMPDEILACREILELVLPIIRADYEAHETYLHRTGDPLDCPITAFGGSADPTVDRQSLEDWSIHTTRQFTSLLFPGGHFFLHEARQQMSEKIVKDLGVETGGRLSG